MHSELRAEKCLRRGGTRTGSSSHAVPLQVWMCHVLSSSCPIFVLRVPFGPVVHEPPDRDSVSPGNSPRQCRFTRIVKHDNRSEVSPTKSLLGGSCSVRTASQGCANGNPPQETSIQQERFGRRHTTGTGNALPTRKHSLIRRLVQEVDDRSCLPGGEEDCRSVRTSASRSAGSPHQALQECASTCVQPAATASRVG